MKEHQTNDLERLACYKARITQLEHEMALLQEQLKQHNETAKRILSMSDEQQEILFAMNKLFLDTYFVNFSTDDCRFVAATCTETFTKYARGSYDQILQEYVSHSVHKADRSMVSKFGSREYARTQLTNEHPFYAFTYRRLLDSQYRWYRMHLILSSTLPDGSLGNVIVAFMDVNDERTALKDAYDAALKASKAKSEFLSAMSHDIRTPMNGIIGMTAIATAHLDEPIKVADCLRKIELASCHMKDLINQVLDMSKIESGKTTLIETPFQLMDLIQSVDSVVRPQAQEKRQEYSLSVRNICHSGLIGDIPRLTQILVNISGNAIKYTQEAGTIQLDITELPTTNPDYANLQFTVTDNGIGMSAEFQAHLFEAFSQEAEWARTEAKGSGLGLAITHNLVNMMGGAIHVKSKLGEGSSFLVHIPLRIWIKPPVSQELPSEQALSPHPSSAPRNPSAEGFYIVEKPGEIFHDPKETPLMPHSLLSPEGKPLPIYKGKRLLVAEDNLLNREILLEILKDRECLADAAENGQMAVSMFLEKPSGYYDAILMDIRMPVMDGYEAAMKIRSSDHPDSAKIPIISISADAFSNDMHKSLCSGMNAHLPKPLDFSLLDQELRKFFSDT